MANRIPRHIAIIMDGNGRWANKRNLPRMQGHQVGVQRVEEIVQAASDMGVQFLTLYAFSKENWFRPKAEVSFLMDLLAQYLDHKLEELRKNNVLFNTIGNISDLPEAIQKKINHHKEVTRENTGLVLTFAFSYSSRDEITKACQCIAKKVAEGLLNPNDISEKTISNHLQTADLPDPDLLVRTSGEMRISNFLLWQISYAELYVTETLWPDFNKDEFQKAIEEYQKRERRFGRTQPIDQDPVTLEN